MTNQSEAINEKDLIVRKDGLIYKKHARVPFTGIGEYLINDGYNGQLMGYNFKDGKREDLVEGFHETNKENVYEALKFLNSLYVYAPFCEFHGLPLLPNDMYNPHPLEDCPTKLTSNKEFMLEASERVYTALDYASDELKQDKELILAALRQDPFYFEKIPEELKTDKKLFYDTAKESFLSLLEGDEDTQCEGFSHYWMKDYHYKSAFAVFCNDEDVADAMFEAISHRPWCYFDFLEFLGPMLNKDKKFMHSIYREMGTYISTEHKGSMDCLDFEHRTLELSDEAIEGHLSGIKEYMGEFQKEIEQLTEQESKLFEKTLKDLPDKPFKNLYGKNWALEKRATAWKIIKKKKI